MIGLFGGSFNPIHNGHLEAARIALSCCDELWFLPCYRHAFKPSLEAFRHRKAMVKLAIKKEKRFKLCLIEEKLYRRNKRPNTTLATVLAIKKAYPREDFFWVIGSELLDELPRWHKFEKLKKEIKFFVVPIKGQKVEKKILQKIDACIASSEAEPVSSTMIRKMIAHGVSPKKFLPEDVWNYIERNMLYAGDFAKKVYALTKLVPKGKVTTYKDIALALNCRAFRAIGNALNRNPFETVPCHRVVKSDGTIGGFRNGEAEKAKILENESLLIERGKILDFENKRVSWQELILLKKFRKKC